jgi:hypothetical protein
MHRANRKLFREILRLMLWLLWLGALLAGDSLPSLGQPRDDGSFELPEVPPLLTVQTNCEAMVPAYCQGTYGFQVTGNGKWRAGPDPSGQSLSGRVPKKENHALRRAADRVLRNPPRQPSECDRRQAIPGVGETVTVQGPGRVVKLQGAGGQLNSLCAPGHITAAVEFFALADALMRRYYPRPFPRQ